MTVDEFIDKLAKPIMVLRFARAQENNTYNKGLAKGAKKRAANARLEIDRIVREYCDIEKESLVSHRGYMS